ncbi:hypothetical protein AUJ68_00175 [Candidatus Woesearchaeota archaeon CG1_02_57_44]|nr:MAG: hypothetical protein AUJ68_00175 [Candidatus Woesearchaeota archaeon CG1_02_57_44]PIN68434.1 MAG: hypothetical protein COV94_04650 [Candidatus Woesearchaeota archaeon CG11_big_fil_rev_8_21_14_0_20_57_5]
MAEAALQVPDPSQIAAPSGVFPIRIRKDELHNKFGGGLPKNGFMLVEGRNALGKSIIAQRFCYGLVCHGVSVTYVSTELSLPSFVNQMKSLQYDINDALVTGQLNFVSVFPYVGDTNVGRSVLSRLRMEELFHSDVIIFDSLNGWIVPDDVSLKEAFEVIKFFRKVTSQDKSIIFTIDPEQYDNTYSTLLKSVSEVYMKLGTVERFGTVTKLIRVERFNGAVSDVEENIAFRVRAGVGIVMEITSAS